MKQNKIPELLDSIRQRFEVEEIPPERYKQVESCLEAALDHLNPQETRAKKKKGARVKKKVAGDSIIAIWSDGACSGNPGPGGWGTIVQQNGDYLELSGFSQKTTNNIMEMTGALEGIRQTPEGARLELTSDSQYLVKGMNEWIKGWKRRNWKKADGQPVLNRELWMELDKEASLRKIEWKWIKGHAGHSENERCDELAREAITNRRGI